MKYNVGDRVRIKNIDWYNENKDKAGIIKFDYANFIPEMSRYCGEILTINQVVEERKQYHVSECAFVWTDEMIEGLVEEECPQDFIEKYCKSCGTQRCDRTKEYLDGCPYYNAYMCKTKNNAMEEEIKPKFKVGDKITNGKDTLTILTLSSDRYVVEDTFGECGTLYFNFVDDWKIVEEDNEVNIIDEYVHRLENNECQIDLPEGYQFIDEDGNVISATKIVLEKKPDNKLKLESTKKVREYWSEYARIYIEIYDNEPNECVLTHLYTLEGHRQKGYGRQALIEAESIAKELGCHTAYLKVETNSWMHEWYLRMGYKWYKTVDKEYVWLAKNLTSIEKKEYPKTYEECSAINGCEGRISLSIIGKFTKLINARNAYWRVVGKEMGLGKPWKPDWTNQKLPKYCIAGVEGQIKTAERYIVNTILAFPTVEMRDAFYEAFKEEIEICKEFL